MAITQSIKPAYAIGLNIIPIITAKEKASLTSKEGAVLIPATASSAQTGYVDQASSDPTIERILGVALKDGANAAAAGTDMPMCPALPNVVFEGQLYNASSASVAIAQTDQWKKYALALVSTKWVVDKADVTNTRVLVIGFKDAIGTVNGIVYFCFLGEATMWWQDE